MKHWAYTLWHKYLQGKITNAELVYLTRNKQLHLWKGGRYEKML